MLCLSSCNWLLWLNSLFLRFDYVDTCGSNSFTYTAVSYGANSALVLPPPSYGWAFQWLPIFNNVVMDILLQVSLNTSAIISRDPRPGGHLLSCDMCIFVFLHIAKFAFQSDYSQSSNNVALFHVDEVL